MVDIFRVDEVMDYPKNQLDKNLCINVVQLYNQWPFQEPKLEVPTIYQAYFLGLNFREYPHKIWPNIWY